MYKTLERIQSEVSTNNHEKVLSFKIETNYFSSNWQKYKKYNHKDKDE